MQSASVRSLDQARFPITLSNLNSLVLNKLPSRNLSFEIENERTFLETNSQEGRASLKNALAVLKIKQFHLDFNDCSVRELINNSSNKFYKLLKYIEGKSSNLKISQVRIRAIKNNQGEIKYTLEAKVKERLRLHGKGKEKLEITCNINKRQFLRLKPVSSGELIQIRFDYGTFTNSRNTPVRVYRDIVIKAGTKKYSLQSAPYIFTDLEFSSNTSRRLFTPSKSNIWQDFLAKAKEIDDLPKNVQKNFKKTTLSRQGYKARDTKILQPLAY